MNSILFKAELIPLIRTLPSNDQGRDYVVGDLHGCRQLLDQLLEFVDFSPENDRLFSVGDLIDRGSDSLGCLALLEKPWFYAVRGNHEEMLLDFAWKYIQNCSSLGSMQIPILLKIDQKPHCQHYYPRFSNYPC